MKSPRKPNWFIFVLSAVLDVVLIGFVALPLFNFDHIISWSEALFSLFTFLTLLILGFAVSITSDTIFHRKVDHPVDPKDLEVDRTYWLNGETWAIYKGQDDYTGKYNFSIYGLNKAKKPDDVTNLYPGQAKQYISTIREVMELNDNNYPH